MLAQGEFALMLLELAMLKTVALMEMQLTTCAMRLMLQTVSLNMFGSDVPEAKLHHPHLLPHQHDNGQLELVFFKAGVDHDVDAEVAGDEADHRELIFVLVNELSCNMVLLEEDLGPT